MRALGEREVGAWLLPRSWVEPALGTLDDAQSSIVIVSPQQQEERARDAVQRAANEIFAPPERRALFATRFDETAYLFARRGHADLARALVSAAEATRAGRPVGEIPVLAQITAASLALMAQIRQRQAREEKSSSLIVTPEQALEEQRLAALRRER